MGRSSQRPQLLVAAHARVHAITEQLAGRAPAVDAGAVPRGRQPRAAVRCDGTRPGVPHDVSMAARTVATRSALANTYYQGYYL